MSRTARSAAAAALVLALRGVHAQEALDRSLGDLAPNERALATELTYGTLRRQGALDVLLSHVSGRPMRGQDPKVRVLLWLGAYQLRHTRIPAYAAVAATLETADQIDAGQAKSFVNAVLRRLTRTADPWPANLTPAERHALEQGHPPWLVARWLARFGPADTDRLLSFDNEAPPLGVRLNPLQATPDVLAQELGSAGIALRPSGLCEESFVAAGSGRVAHWPGFAEGHFSIQDPAATLVGHLLGAQAGERVLDVCAGLGTKACHLLELSSDRAEVWALDLDARKLQLARAAAQRLGLQGLRTAPSDLRRPPDPALGMADRVLVDAPCSNLGVLRRRPEARWRSTAADLKKMRKLQTSILEHASALVRPGGALAYVTCSLEPEETDQVVEHFLRAHSEFEAVPWVLVPDVARQGAVPHSIFLFPPEADCDGLYAAHLRHRG